jgi:hypothetical protein
MSMKPSIKSLLVPTIAITGMGVLLLGWAYSVKREVLALALHRPKASQEGPPRRHGFRGDLIGYGEKSVAIRSVRPDNRVALLTLANADQFIDRYSEFSENTPEYVRAFDRLSRDRAALLAFRELVSQAAPSGRVYGLCGLYFTHSGVFLRAQAQLFQTAPLPVWYWPSYDVALRSSTRDLSIDPEKVCRNLGPLHRGVAEIEKEGSRQ